jgi:hypothetical protein
VTVSPVRYSRAAASVARLAGADSHRFLDKPVLLTGDTDVLATANGAEMARCALQLLMRISRDLSVWIPPVLAGLAEELATFGAHMAWDEQPQFTTLSDPASYAAILSIGGTVHAELPWTAITSNGWLTRVSSGPTPLSHDCGAANPVGALAAASLGVSEVFKRLIGLKPEHGELLNGVTFSLWDHAVGTELAGPPLPGALPLNLVLNGAGAIGSALVHLIGKLPSRGRITIVDNQNYGEENWGTCLDLARDEVGKPKAEVAVARLPASLDAKPFVGDIRTAMSELFGQTRPWPRIAMNGLDQIEARHDAQQFWPDLAIDGALDANFTLQVSCHPQDGDVACLICLFRPPAGEAAAAAQSRVTGLTPETIARGPDYEISEAEVRAAAPDKQEFLAARIGRKICSIVTEAQQLSTQQQRAGFAPSVPFVACLSACLEVTELVRFVTTGTTAVAPRYQMNMLMGPETAMMVPERRRTTCICVERANNIARVRAQRR